MPKFAVLTKEELIAQVANEMAIAAPELKEMYEADPDGVGALANWANRHVLAGGKALFRELRKYALE